MVIEDARELTAKAVGALQDNKDQVGFPDLKIDSVQGFLTAASKQQLKRSEKEMIVKQAILLIDQFYAHLPFKRARYAIDPVQRLRLIHSQIDDLPDLQFHCEMIRAFVRLRDAHTYYGLPRPYRGAFAFLPFRLESFYRRGKQRFMVTEIMDGFDHPYFGPKAEVTCWNGMPVQRAIEGESLAHPSGNMASRSARGLMRMTARPLTYSLPPDEEWVMLEYIPAGRKQGDTRGILIPWNIISGVDKQDPRKHGTASIFEPLAETKRTCKLLWRSKYGATVATYSEVLQAEDAAAKPGLQDRSPLPDVFEFAYTGGPDEPGGIDVSALHDPAHPDSRFGYIKIKTFDHDSDEFVEEFARILDVMKRRAPSGLVLDVRSNPGGNIQAGERILQLLTPNEIETANFHFLSTRLTQQIATTVSRSKRESLTAAVEQFEPWVKDLLASLVTGNMITDGRPLTDPDLANGMGQRYQGPVVLIIDGLSYSATDIFAGGFQDNGIGKIIGVDQSTGGGGANRWTHDELLQNLPDFHNIGLEKLPNGATMALAVRRSTRVGRNSGGALEDVGVEADLRHAITEHDLLGGDQDLLRFACRKLGGIPSYFLEVERCVPVEGGVDVAIRSKNLDRIECFLDGYPQCSLAAAPEQAFRVPGDGLPSEAEQLLVRGLARAEDGEGATNLQVVVAVKTALQRQPDAANSAKAGVR